MFLIMPSVKLAQTAPLWQTKWLSDLNIRNILKRHLPPKPKVQIQNNFTELFPIMPSAKLEIAARALDKKKKRKKKSPEPMGPSSE